MDCVRVCACVCDSHSRCVCVYRVCCARCECVRVTLYLPRHSHAHTASQNMPDDGIYSNIVSIRLDVHMASAYRSAGLCIEFPWKLHWVR